MGKFIDQGKTQVSTKNIRSQSSISQIRAEVLSKVTIPMYFYNIIIPQLGNYFDQYPVNFDNDPRACCPLHDENTPSFRYFENTSSFFCFGCRKGGSIINLHIYFAERINGTAPTKEEAIAFLYNYFIKGKETATYIDKAAQTIDKEEKLNTDADIVKFNVYRMNLEQSITFDKTLRLEVKEEIWSLLDTVDILLSKNLINVNSAENYIKAKVKQLITTNSHINLINITKGKVSNNG